MNIPLRKNCSVVKKYPAFRDKFVNGSWKWIEGKRKDDYAEGLWRVHDKLYDLTEFVGKHPGGEYWLEITKGTDVTEAFETHHFSNEPAKVLAKYYVKDAADPRNYFFTYDDNGFYKTLKERVGAKLQKIDASYSKKSELIHDLNLIGLFISAIFLTRSESDVLKGFWTLVAAQLLAWTANFSHNFVHQKDNWRMYTANLTLITWRDFRVFHVLSHHMYSNSYSDFEQSCYEPYYKWIPTQEKSWFYKIFAVLISPVLYITFFHNMWRYRIQGVLWANQKVLHWDELISVALPVILILFGKEPMSEKLTWAHLSIIYTKWSYIFVPAQLLFGSHFFNRGHHATNLVHQNDEIKSFDFGEYQISTTVDRSESKVNSFTSLAYFGDQVLHHLFPTVDSSALPLLRETLSQTCKEFDVDLKPQISMGKAAFEQFMQLFRSDTMRNL